jgi:hypothetical protein
MDNVYWCQSNQYTTVINFIENTEQFFDLDILFKLDTAIQKNNKKFVIYSGGMHAENIEKQLTKNGFTSTPIGNNQSKETIVEILNKYNKQVTKLKAEFDEQISKTKAEFDEQITNKDAESKKMNNVQKLMSRLQKPMIKVFGFIKIVKIVLAITKKRQKLKISEENLQTIDDFKLTPKEIKKYELRELPTKILKKACSITIKSMALACVTGLTGYIIKKRFPSLWQWGKNKLSHLQKTISTAVKSVPRRLEAPL